VTFTATASTANPGGSIAGVQLYDGTTLLGSGAAAGAGTWTYAWNTTGATAGAHNVKAKATDNLGGTATSSPAVVVQLSGGPVVLLKYTFPTALASNATGTAYDPTTIASGLDTTATGTALMRFGWGSGLTGGGTNIGSNGYATDPEVQVHPTAGTGANSTASTTIANSQSSRTLGSLGRGGSLGSGGSLGMVLR